MLSHITIRDFAIIDQLELEFSQGLTVMTGETGAGKSILIDALGLALGDRGDSAVVRAGAARADISVTFDANPATDAWLAEQELDGDPGEYLVRRVVSSEGRSKAWLNGAQVTLAVLREFGEQLVDVHGQHEHQSLLRKDTHRQIVDEYAGLFNPLAELRELFSQWRDCDRRYQALSTASAERDARVDLLRFQVSELSALAPEQGEYESLSAEHKTLANAGDLIGACQTALNLSYEAEDGSAHTLLSQAIQTIANGAELDSKLAEISELLNGAALQAQEAGDSLRRYLDGIEIDPERLHAAESRLASLHDAARKHHCDPEQLPEVHEKLSTEFNELENADESIADLERQRAALGDEYLIKAAALSEQRVQAADELSQRVSAVMHELGMPNGRFEVDIKHDADGKFQPHGLDQIQFTVAANPGQPAGPLNKVASGGELSRISLAIQVIAADVLRTPVLVFDEVDTGIGGGVAEIVGEKLRALGADRQILCVTHLPQVAAHGHEHFHVSKRVSADQTFTQIETLAAADRIDELARMLGGVELTTQSKAHAAEMFDAAQAKT